MLVYTTPIGRYAPASQVAGSRTLLPSAHRKPEPQSRHALWPTDGWYLDSGHGKQSVEPEFGEWVPAVQFIGTTAPAKQNVPALHGTH